MAKMTDLKVVVSVDARTIKPSATGADVFDVPVTIRHNHDDPTTTIPIKLFVQDMPLGTIDAADNTTETVTTKLDRSKPFKVRIVRAGSKDGDETDVPWDALPKAATGSVIKVVNPPRDLDPVSGLFLVTVVTEKDGKPRTLPFTTVSNIALTTTQQILSEGVCQVRINFTGLQAKITFRLSNGSEAVLHLRK